MLLANIGIILGVYSSVKLFKHYISNKYTTKLAQTPHSKVELSSIETKEIIITNKTVVINKHHFKISTVNVGVAIASYAYPPVLPITMMISSYNIIPLIERSHHSIQNKEIGNDLVTAGASVLTLSLGLYLPCAIQNWAYYFGHNMIYNAKDHSEKKLINIFEQQPNKVWIKQADMEIEVALESLSVGQVVVVKTGEVIPIDGIIMSGMATIDQHTLTGEAIPVEKEIGDRVFASTFVASGWLHITVEKKGQETTIAKLGEILKNTSDFKTGLQLQGEKWADKAAFPLLGLSAITLPMIGISSAAAILYSAPTNTVRILTSLQTSNYFAVVSSKGILIKDGRALENLIKIDTVLFDKTGTLTEEQPKIGHIIVCCEELTEETILTYAASAEGRLTHPVARAIVDKAKKRYLFLPEIDDASYKTGYGITVKIKQQMVHVGSIRFMELEKIYLPTIIKNAIQDAHENGYSLVMVAIDHELKGAIEIRPQVRPEAKRIIETLRQQGIKKIAIVSGDHEQPTQKLAEELKIDDYFYEVLPQNKAALVEQLQVQGHQVCFVGDGVNDVIAMKKANVSISLQGASSIATDVAQIVLMDSNLSRLSDVFEISKNLNKNLQRTLAALAIYGVGNITASVVFRFGLVQTTLVYLLVLTTGMTYAMLPLRQIEQDKQQPIQSDEIAAFIPSNA